jgi:DNA (cytosine-5)-methyltransferase 1
MQRLAFIDLFAGLGGFHLGLAALGHRCVFACESDEGLRQLYLSNFGLMPYSDIRNLSARNVPEHQFLCAGFPCQPFSKAGEQLGLACARDGDLFRHLLRIVRHHRPPYLLLENVANLERHCHGETYRRMRKSLEALGYEVDQRVLSPHRFGIPQIRDRLFIVGSLAGLDHFEWPCGTSKPPSIFDVLDPNPRDAKAIPDHYVECLEAWQQFLDRFPPNEQLPSFPIWSMEFGADYPYEQTTPARIGAEALACYRGPHGRPLSDLPRDSRLQSLPSYARERDFPAWKQQFIRQNRELYARHRAWIDRWIPSILKFPPSLQKLEWNCKGGVRRIRKYVIQFRASGVRIKRPNAAPSLIAMTTTQVPIIAAESRYMTVRECSRLQGMGELPALPSAPSKAYRALGNAVNADLVRVVAERLIGRNGESPIKRARSVKDDGLLWTDWDQAGKRAKRGVRLG